MEAEVAKDRSNIETIEERRKQAKGSLDRLEKIFADQSSRFSSDLDETRKDLANAKQQCDELEQQLYADGKVRQMLRSGELAELDIKIRQAETQLQSKRGKLEVRAPFAGQVVFSHSSPGAALNSGPIVVLSPPEGLRFHFLVDEKQVDALRGAGVVTVELEETSNSIEQRFPGKFLQAKPLARDPGQLGRWTSSVRHRPKPSPHWPRASPSRLVSAGGRRC